ncbi:hypothetical protein CY34DRAFT_22655 [Suillus luteus UH-Slu-Lm8-n1]|uniref:Retrotransposon Copia-like N-terminal domain-containing protein n=1 Tax=Suillus luteus UH-Slu-Lm8-n1 TaxID=930992 RepID=A0A0D0BGB5_9AGAM|nr:hypothetical protein CY34DRAFT_22655 [Suillus luteus UH-Slu-Lm8-n1]
MGKYDHITELSGAETYPSWRRAIMLVLASEGLWNHCSEGIDPNNYEEFASVMPSPVAPGAPTSTERTSILEWIKEDAQTKAIISQRLSPVIQNMLGEKVTARQQWQTLHKRFARLDITSQFELRDQLFSEKLKDTSDASRYLSVFENG